MNCSRFETLLTDYLEGTLDSPVADAVESHRQSCLDCQALWEEVQVLVHQLNTFPVVSPPAYLMDRILEKTTGKPKVRSLWADLIVPTLQPFLTQRYAFATIVLFVFLSLMVNLAGPPVAAFLSPSRFAEGADRLSTQVSKKWAELRDYRARAVEEITLLSEDLYGRIDYHLISMLFKSYAESIEERSEDQTAEPSEGATEEEQQ